VRRIRGLERALMGAASRRDAACTGNLLRHLVPAWFLYCKRKRHLRRACKAVRFDRKLRLSLRR
jgi:hypothetical protein